MNLTFKSIAAAAATVFAGACFAAAPNLVANGDFESGSSDFSSDYVYSPAANSAERQFTVAANPPAWNAFFVAAANHTSGGSLMYIGNGSPNGGDMVWGSGDISVVPHTKYFFEAFVMNVCCNAAYIGPNSAAVLEFRASSAAGSVSLATFATDLTSKGTWQGLSTTWDSGDDTYVSLRLLNSNTQSGGNDFALDDVYLGTESTVGSVPEPQTHALMLVGVCCVAGLVWRTRRLGA